jgi:hypothetical protein
MSRCVYWIIFLGVLAGLGLTIVILPPWSGGLMEQSLDAGQEEVIQRFKDRQTISLAWQLTQNLLQKEDERFRHIDTKSSAFLGMLGVALTILASIVSVLIDKDFIIRLPRDFRILLGFLWILTFIFLIASFVFSLDSIQVVADPKKGGHRDLPTNVIIGPEQVLQDSFSFQKALIAEAW